MKSALPLTVALTALFCGHAAWAAATVHTRIFTGSGTLTVPANVKPATEYQFIVVGGGGGAGGCHDVFTSGGGSGGAGYASFSGFNPSDTITITVGSGGAGGNTSGSNGGNGATSKLTYSGIDIVAGTGGGGSLGGTLTAPGSAGTFSATAGSTALTLQSSLNYAAQDGIALNVPLGQSSGLAIPGGGNPIGHSGTFTNHNGALGGGGLGCISTPATGGAGGGGVVIISWTA
jgi:hypothetical protein